MYDRFGYPGLFGAYNAGPARYAAFVSDGRPLPAETRAYVRQLWNGPIPNAAQASIMASIPASRPKHFALEDARPDRPVSPVGDRRGVVEGTRGSARVDLGGGGLHK